jgi:DNA topoisomerase-1
MNKKASKNTSINVLVIVESPAKCKKIEAYLGPGYKVIASFGHLRCLNGLQSIDIENGFKPTYTIIQETIKLKQIEKIRSEIAKADDVILATDSDREGEAIAWHICDLFGLSVEKTKRIVFNEVTEKALQTAIRQPKQINMNLVEAQQSRQILDLLVGFIITPYLWKCISNNHKNSLSAGRCQTPALKLVYENHLEIQKAPGQLLYDTTGYFTNLNLKFDMNKQFTIKEDVQQFLEHCKKAKYSCSTTNPKKSIRKAPEPLTTSLLQQMASNELHMSPKETMKYAQQLYEGGYITYMRTDSKKYSGEFVEQVKTYIETNYGATYLSQNIDALVDKRESSTTNNTLADNINKKELKEPKEPMVQEAHEAIRPVLINVKTIVLEDCTIELAAKAIRLYALIWARTIESCMASAQYNIITAKIQMEPQYKYDGSICEFAYKTEQVSFAGWQIIENVSTAELSKEYQYFTVMKQNMLVIPKKIESKFNLLNLKSHFTEAKLVQLLEEKGIGRPSTFAALIDKIQEREYVKKQNLEGRQIECEDYLLVLNETNADITSNKVKRVFGNETNKLVIQPLGIIVIEFLLDKFNTFFNYDYTREMENALDLIATNKKQWTSLCDECNKELIEVTKGLKDETKFALKIDDIHTLIIGKYGPVIKKQIKAGQPATFIPVKKDLDINHLQQMTDIIKLEDLIESVGTKDTGTKDTGTNDTGTNDTGTKAIGKYKGEDLFIKKGKYGIYAEYGKGEKRERISLKELEGKPLELIEYIEVLRILERDTTLDPSKPVGFVRELSPTLSIRTGKFGDYIFYKKPRVKQPQFFKLNGFAEGSTKGLDARKCDKELLLNWIKLTYKVE